MMKYIVSKPFKHDSGYKMSGETVELSDELAAKYRALGLIGGRYEQPIQTAVIVEPEIREAVIKPVKKSTKAKK